jgi:hypothetical protein
LAHDDPQNANLISAIDRRREMPVALGILYIHAAGAAGFDASGLNSPGHFLLRIGLRGGKTFMDPFNGFGGPPSTRTVGAEVMATMRAPLKSPSEWCWWLRDVPKGAPGAARKAYESCLTLTRAGSILHNEAALALQGLKRRLN